MQTQITLHDLKFEPYLSEATIRERVREVAKAIETDFKGKCPVFLAILNGSFVFAADLIRACNIPSEIAFTKLSSYEGLRSSGEVKMVFGADIDLANRHVIVVEDIIDSGRTMDAFLPALQAKNPASLSLAVLLLKPDALEFPVKADYLGFEIPDKFVVGYGLDYNELGRNLPGIYQLATDER
ncbi:MAG: hypoxanthine phosphoribosyltransferase [Bacteroidetes bacterium]|nr:MAG: hypoxanthine phosphoribosyltransferase [Bacteroidota bacterium]